MNNNIHIYLPYGGNTALLKDCIASLVREVAGHTENNRFIYVLNDTMKKIDWNYIGTNLEKHCVELIPTVRLVHSQMLNWILKLAKQNDNEWAIGFHTNAFVHPGGFDILLDGIEKAEKEDRVALVNTGAFMLLYAINMKFIKDENWEWKPQLFPMYFEDNHFHSFIKSCGWKVLQTEKYNVAAFHYGSHVIRDNPIFSSFIST